MSFIGALHNLLSELYYAIEGQDIMKLTLDILEPGSLAKVSRIRTAGAMRNRLSDLGVEKGTRIKCLQKSPLSDPVAYDIHGSVIAIRNRDAALIEIEGIET